MATQEQIQGTSFTRADEENLVRLMRLAEADRERTGFAWPTEGAMRAVHAAVSMWAFELVITRHGQSANAQVLLSKYDGGATTFADMWHIPGGYPRKHAESIEDVCNQIAQRELRTNVTFRDVMDVHLWTPSEHPYGRPLALYMRCGITESIEETDRLRWFDLKHLPKPMVPVHLDWLIKMGLRLIVAA